MISMTTEVSVSLNVIVIAKPEGLQSRRFQIETD